jgi:hypothetical protein
VPPGARRTSRPALAARTGARTRAPRRGARFPSTRTAPIPPTAGRAPRGAHPPPRPATHQVLRLDALQHRLHVGRGVVEALHAHDTLEDRVHVLVSRLMVHDARAVDQEDALHERDVLPHLGLARHRGRLADLATGGAGPGEVGWGRGPGARTQAEGGGERGPSRPPRPTFFVRSALMTELLPTLGYPMNPTLMAFLSDRSRASWRSRLRSEPLPKGLVTLAWKASVGNSRDRVWSQRLVTQAGTCRGWVGRGRAGRGGWVPRAGTSIGKGGGAWRRCRVPGHKEAGGRAADQQELSLRCEFGVYLSVVVCCHHASRPGPMTGLMQWRRQRARQARRGHTPGTAGAGAGGGGAAAAAAARAPRRQRGAHATREVGAAQGRAAGTQPNEIPLGGILQRPGPSDGTDKLGVISVPLRGARAQAPLARREQSKTEPHAARHNSQRHPMRNATQRGACSLQTRHLRWAPAKSPIPSSAAQGRHTEELPKINPTKPLHPAGPAGVPSPGHTC